jgi:hypothetical protein
MRKRKEEKESENGNNDRADDFENDGNIRFFIKGKKARTTKT